MYVQLPTTTFVIWAASAVYGAEYEEFLRRGHPSARVHRYQCNPPQVHDSAAAPTLKFCVNNSLQMTENKQYKYRY
jgi:hypothetical protein